ncbi:hypothetical protein [uncultured Xanthomonas sp.]|uniref:hypothetical protein n=1 Tax=uncultured Xanthomonas sp. TaxID=152831 RepID=UPI0025EC1129|nr:hypothetical protein [uncultured Xanthomonas sp.]
MNPYTTTKESSDGRILLPLQCDGVQYEKIKDLLTGEKLQSINFPNGQELSLTWFVRLNFASGVVAEITSSSTLAFENEELGSINFGIVSSGKLQADLEDFEVKDFTVANVQILSFSIRNFTVDAGLVITSGKDEKMFLAAGEFPGSISVAAPFISGSFAPQFPIGDYELRCFMVP